MRACIVLQKEGKIVPFAREVFRAYWERDLDISEERVLCDVCLRAGVDGHSLLAKIETPEIKDTLRRNTDELMMRGGFGSPTIFVNHDDMYFGNDRLPLVRHALAREVRPSSEEENHEEGATARVFE